MPQLRIHPRRVFGGGFGIIGGGGALMYMDGLGVQKNRGPTKLLELSWATDLTPCFSAPSRTIFSSDGRSPNTLQTMHHTRDGYPGEDFA